MHWERHNFNHWATQHNSQRSACLNYVYIKDENCKFDKIDKTIAEPYLK